MGRSQMIHNRVRIISDIMALCLFKEAVLKEGWEETKAAIVVPSSNIV